MKKSITFVMILSVIFLTAFVKTALVDDSSGLKFKAHHESVHENGNHCAACHETEKGQYVPDYISCIQCHGDGAMMADLTSHMDPNPHISNHYGTDVDCTACHSEHGESFSICARCHLFEFPGLK